MNFQWHKLQKQKQRTNMTDITNFSDGEKQTLYNQEIQNNFHPSVATIPHEQWTYIADVCKDTGKEILGHKERKHKINDPELKELSHKKSQITPRHQCTQRQEQARQSKSRTQTNH